MKNCLIMTFLIWFCLMSYRNIFSDDSSNLMVQNKMKAIEELANCHMLTTSHVYEGGETSSYAYYFSLLYYEEFKMDPSIFDQLYNQSNYIYGKIYAATAYCRLNKEKYLSLKNDFDLKQKINLLIGCCSTEMTLEEYFRILENENFIDKMLIWPLPPESSIIDVEKD
jgi:hypothetical protein